MSDTYMAQHIKKEIEKKKKKKERNKKEGILKTMMRCMDTNRKDRRLS